jgi:hypothetical protein
MRKRLYPGDHPNTVQSLTSLAVSHRALGQPSTARELEAEADEMHGRLNVRLRQTAT